MYTGENQNATHEYNYKFDVEIGFFMLQDQTNALVSKREWNIFC